MINSKYRDFSALDQDDQDEFVANVGDIVSFKSDIEQQGKVVNVGASFVSVKALSSEGFEGEYLQGANATQVPHGDYWK